MNYEELEKLSLNELIALLDYVRKQREVVIGLMNEATKGTNSYEKHSNSLIACNILETGCEDEIANRAEKIFPQFRIKYSILDE